MHHHPRSGSRREPGRTSRVLAALAVAALGAAAPRLAAAQGGTISGVVVNERTLSPLAGAQVVVQGTRIGDVTDAAGRFQLEGVPGTRATLEASLLGYRTGTQSVPVGATGVQIGLAEQVVSLNELVVTGTPGGTQRRAVGTALSDIDAAEVVRTAPVSSVQDLINGRAPGVVILPGTGTVGSGARIRVRGISSLSLSQEPLIYVDGVRVNNAQATGPINQAFGSSTISRWNDFNPEEIESIEIIKGPAAATLYGTEAANGVIQIITKKGAAGQPSFNFTVRQGANWFANPNGRIWTNYGIDPGTGQVASINYDDLVRLNGPIFRTGYLQEYDANVSGGTALVRYFVDGRYSGNEGIEPNNRDRKVNARANVSIYPSETIDITASAGYVHGRTDLPLESGGGGVTWSTYFSTPANLDLPNRGFYSATPAAYYYAYQDWQSVDRFTGSVQLNHRPTEWFTHRLAVGTDVTGQQDAELVQYIADPEMQYFFSDFEIAGYKDVVDRTVYYNTVDYSATANAKLPFFSSSATSGGVQYYRRYSRFVEGYGEGFPARGLSSITAATGMKTAVEDYVENKTFGVFVQEQLGLRQDRVFVTGAVRADDNSAFGQNFDLVYYPKVSGTWVVSEEPFWPVPALSTLKLRAAYGESGQQPESFAALRTYAPIPGPGGTSAVTPQFLGNPDLGPERSDGVELGFDAGLFDDRLGLEFTWYRQRTTDAILLKDIAPSTGFFNPDATNGGRQFINAGEILNRGVELGANLQILQGERVGWEAGLNLATNANEVVDLGLPDATCVSAGSFLRHCEGYPVGAWWEKRLVGAQFDAEGTLVAGSELCDDGKGGSIACSEAPLVYLGRPTPRTEGAFTTSLTLGKSLRLGGLPDFKTGYSKLNGNDRVRCVLFRRCRENFFPAEYVDNPAWLAMTQRGGAFVDGLIQDAGFAKLRELSATYTVPARWASRFGASRATITVAGRNLYTWTDYTGLEPEASFLGGTRGGGSAQWEQNVTPQLQQFVTTINLSF
jgi:TonB-linked SusC/RagA family outer membrane protein